MGPITVSAPSGQARPVINPATGAVVAQAVFADADTARRAAADARVWDAPAAERAAVLRRAADLYEDNFGEIFAILAQEAGKSLPDAVGELREAVDFLRYYAAEGEARAGAPRGVIAAISPWELPAGDLLGSRSRLRWMAGNAVLAKPVNRPADRGPCRAPAASGRGSGDGAAIPAG